MWGQNEFISCLEDGWFVILKLTQIYRTRSALFFEGNQLCFGFDLQGEQDTEPSTVYQPTGAHKNHFILAKLTWITGDNDKIKETP